MGNTLRDQLLAKSLAPKSVDLYVRTIWSAEDWCRDHGHELRTASPSLIADYVATKPNTWSSRKLLRSALGHYWQLTRRRNPPLGVIRVPRKPRMVCRALEEDEARVLARAVRGRCDNRGMATALGLYQSLRREEISQLRADAFDDGWLTVTGKGGLTATLPVHPVVAELLVAYLGAVDRRGSPFLFPGRVQGHVSPTTVWTWTRAVAAEAGLRAVPPHVLRHTALATANDVTGDLRAVQEFARHARPETTAGYTRATRRRLVAVVHAIDYEAVPA